MANYLDGKKNLISSYWFDQFDAVDRIHTMASKHKVPLRNRPELRRFIDQGYAILSATPKTLELVDSLVEDVDRAWSDQAGTVMYAGPAKNRTILRDLDPATRRVPGYRIPDIHGASKACQQLILLDETFSFINALLDEPAVAFQSLYFEWGSQQGLHRDPMFVHTLPPSGLLASWLALEDIHPDSGPLVYVPGSHRYPYFEFVPGDVYLDKGNDRPDLRRAFREQYLALMSKHGHKEQRLTCKKGDILIWHGSLIHGGSPVADRNRTRKSLVVHYAPHATKDAVSNSLFVVDRQTGKGFKKVKSSSEVISKGKGRLLGAPFTEKILKNFVAQGLTAMPDHGGPE